MLAIPAARASEGGGYYDRLGQPVYQALGSKGQPVKVDIRHAKALGLLPGVTTIIKQKASPNLTKWVEGGAILMAYEVRPEPEESPDDYKRRLQAMLKEEGEKRMGLGTAIHAAVESHYRNEPPSAYAEYAIAVSRAIEARWPGLRWVPERSFACRLGYGGKCDLHAAIPDNPIAGIVIDVKSKDFGTDADPTRFVYDDHRMQLQAYADGLFGRAEPTARANVFVSTTATDASGLPLVHIVEHEKWEDIRARRMFDACLDLWIADNGYNPSWS